MYSSHGANTCHPDSLTANLKSKAPPLLWTVHLEKTLLLCEWLQSAALTAQPLQPITFNTKITVCTGFRKYIQIIVIMSLQAFTVQSVQIVVFWILTPRSFLSWVLVLWETMLLPISEFKD